MKIINCKQMTLKITKSNNLYIALLSLVGFTIPLPMLLNNIAIILFVGFWLVLGLTKKLIKPSIKSVLFLSLPFILLVLGSFNTFNYDQLIIELTKSLPFLLFPVIFYTVPFRLTLQQFKTILKAFVAGNIIICIVLLAVIIYQLLLNGFNPQTLWGLTHQSLSAYVSINAIYLSLFLALALLITVYFFLQKRNSGRTLKQIIYFTGITSLLVIILIFLSSRTVLLGCALIISIMVFRYYLETEKLLKALLRFLVAGIVLSILVLSMNPVLKWRIESVVDIQDTEFTVGKEEGIKMRKRLWSSSAEVFANNWLFGVGSGDFYDELNKVYKENKFRIQYRHEMNSHNQYLSYLVSNGIVGLLLFIFYMFYPIRMYFKSKRWLPFFITILFVLSYITESYLYTNKGVVVVAFFMTLMFHFYSPVSNKTDLVSELELNSN